MTTAVILVELGVAVAGGLVFLVLYGLRSQWRQSPMGRHMMAFTAVMVGEVGALLALGLGLPVPLWVFVVVFGLLDLVVIQRLVLLLRAQRRTG